MVSSSMHAVPGRPGSTWLFQHGLLNYPTLAKVQQVPRKKYLPTYLPRRYSSLPLEGRGRMKHLVETLPRGIRSWRDDPMHWCH